MRITPVAIVSLLALALATPHLGAEDQPPADIPESVHIDPAAFLPEAFGQVVADPIENVPLVEAVPMIAELAGLPARVVQRHFDESGIPSDVPVTLHAGLPLYMALDRMCWETVLPGSGNHMGLAWVIDRGILSFTTQSGAVDWMIVRAYDIGDLSETRDQDAQLVIDLIQNHTHFAEWVDIDGIGGEIDCLGNVLVVRQTFGAQRKVAALLAGLRSDARTIYIDRPPHSASMDAAFGQTIEGSLDGVVLSDVIQTLSDQTGVEIRFDPLWMMDDRDEFDAARFDVPVTYPIISQDLRTTLDLLLEAHGQYGLDYIVRHHAVWISNEFHEQETQETILYRIDDIVVDDDYQALIDLIQSQTTHEWIDIDGIGGEIDEVPDDYLMITHRRQVHAEIADVFAHVRQLFVAPSPADAHAIETRAYEMPDAMATDLREILPQLIAPGTWQGAADTNDSSVGQIHVVRRGGDLSRLVISHTRAVHKQFVDLIKELDPDVYWQHIHRWPPNVGFSSVPPEERPSSETP